jgi:type I restriction and modification enzyme subunit R-like protein
MIEELGYPKGLLSVEKDISSLALPRSSRRIDILCSTPGVVGMRPLLLIECKAGKLTPEAEKQALGYNDAFGAPFVALAGLDEIKTFWRESDGIASVPFLPRYEQLVGELSL